MRSGGRTCRSSGPRQELAAVKEELRLEREEVKRLKEVEQGAVDEATTPFPLTAADVAELFRLLKDMNLNEMRMEREMAGVRRELAELREEVKKGEAAEEAQGGGRLPPAARDGVNHPHVCMGGV